jgi:hypothetical protein
VSVETGISPRELLALDAEMFDAVLEARSERWTTEHELAASALEVAHAHMLLFLRVHSKKNARLPEPLVVERPGQRDEEAKPTPMSVVELARLSGKDGS